jgi:hypothetical protein
MSQGQSLPSISIKPSNVASPWSSMGLLFFFVFVEGVSSAMLYMQVLCL